MLKLRLLAILTLVLLLFGITAPAYAAGRTTLRPLQAPMDEPYQNVEQMVQALPRPIDGTTIGADRIRMSVVPDGIVLPNNKGANLINYMSVAMGSNVQFAQVGVVRTQSGLYTYWSYPYGVSCDYAGSVAFSRDIVFGTTACVTLLNDNTLPLASGQTGVDFLDISGPSGGSSGVWNVQIRTIDNVWHFMGTIKESSAYTQLVAQITELGWYDNNILPDWSWAPVIKTLWVQARLHFITDTTSNMDQWPAGNTRRDGHRWSYALTNSNISTGVLNGAVTYGPWCDTSKAEQYWIWAIQYRTDIGPRAISMGSPPWPTRSPSGIAIPPPSCDPFTF